MTITTLTCPDLVSKRTPARVREAQRRLDHWAMSPKNVRRLTAFVTAEKQAARAELAVTAAKPTGVGSRGGDPAKAKRAAAATAAGHKPGSSEWWKAYRASK